MAGDRARLSIDPGRDYRSVILQQGRVSLEADSNEASRLAETARRLDVVDIIGPVGTSDNGYAVTATASGFTIGAGSYYVGGWRVEAPAALTIGQSADALDFAPFARVDGTYSVALLLTEHEVSAVEDHALLEVALGGPDTGQRSRLMQRAVAIPVNGDYCSDATADVARLLATEGAMIDAGTAAIEPTARLRVSMVSSPAPADPCDPPASGGYLGADNQLIRVSVTAFDPATGTGRLVWGYDNASTLYRASTADGRNLTLEGAPIDSDHSPRLGQAVEVLQTRKRFDHGDVVAADAGVVTTVTLPYDPDLRRVQITVTLPAASRGSADRPLFLRLWEAEMPFTRGVAVELGTTGLAVTLTQIAAPGSIVARPHWSFAARPSTPVIVYPRRYLDAPQPPEGPRQWLAPLAIVEVAREGFRVLDDCRTDFLPLTRLCNGCCGITIDPDMQGHRDVIQRALDKLRGTRGTVTLRPGRYRLRTPIRLDESHKGLTLEGCNEGVFLEAADDNDPAFLEGLIVLDDVNEVALKSLQFQLPGVALTKAGRDIFELVDTKIESGIASVGITATSCAQITVTECQFRFRLREAQPMFAVGFLARGACWGLRMTRNRFLHDIDYLQRPDVMRLLFGYLLVPTLAIGRERVTPRELSAPRLDALIEAGEISDNQFVGLSFAVLIFARMGQLRIERNRVQGCSAGIYLIDTTISATLRIVARASREGDEDSPLPFALLEAAMAFAAYVPVRETGTIALNPDAVRKAARAAEARASSYLEDSGGNDGNGNGGSTRPETGDGEDAGNDVLTIANFVRLAAAVEARFENFAPAVHLHGNDISVFGTLPHNNPDGSPITRRDIERDKSPDAVLLALLVLFELRSKDAADLLATGNRLASLRNPAALIAFPQRLVFGSNIVAGEGGDDKGGALWIVAHPRDALIEVMGNAVDRYVRIDPPQRPEQPSQSWSFVNRVS